MNNLLYTGNKLDYMKVKVISIGNPKAIRLPKSVLNRYYITDSLEMKLEKEFMILKPKKEPRKGWKKAFRKMHENGYDKLLMPNVFEDENIV